MAPKSSLDIAVITFDLGGVLVRVDHWRFCRGLANLAGRKPEEIFTAVFESGLEQDYDTGGLSSREFWRLVASRLEVTLPFPDFASLWNDIFDPMPEMEAVVGRLAGRYPLFLLSNTNLLHFEYIRQHFAAVLRPFQAFVLSYQVSSRKPEAAIYQALIRQAGRLPQEILYLDDKPLFVDAARAQGLHAWQFTTPEDLRQRLEQYGLW